MFRSDEERGAWDCLAGYTSFHWEDLLKEGVPASSAQTYVKRWFKAGMIEIDRQDGNRKWFRRADARTIPEGAAASKTAEDAMWALMRRRAFFSPDDLVVIGGQVGIDIGIKQACTYCSDLVKAGYLRCLEQRVSGRKAGKYRLVNDTGHMAPAKKKLVGLHDRNTGAFTPTGLKQ